jgi:hypothetical protein
MKRTNERAVDRPRAILRAAAFIWGAALFIGSLQPSRPAHIHYGPIHHFAHFLGFGVLTFLLTIAYGNRDRISLWPAVVVFAFGFTIELLQHWVYRMPIEWRDVSDDGMSAVAVAALYQIFRSMTRGLRP